MYAKINKVFCIHTFRKYINHNSVIISIVYMYLYRAYDIAMICFMGLNYCCIIKAMLSCSNAVVAVVVLTIVTFSLSSSSLYIRT